ncbi:MAG: hypothetical protein HRU20_26030 [Pseudomonadales bacterium]|nr:hypothetical protein [Pseudomonadales bacterium]
MNIYNRVVFLGISLLLAAVLVAFGWQSYSSRQYESNFNDSVHLAEKILRTNFHFKSQVQEWKNLLLRGHNPTDETRYWKYFMEQERIVADLLKGLGSSKLDTIILGNIINLEDKHKLLSQRYRQAYQGFRSTDFNAQTADATVSGVDGGLTELLTHTVSLIHDHREKQHKIFRQQSLRVTTIAITIVLIIFFCTILFVNKVMKTAVLNERDNKH